MLWNDFVQLQQCTVMDFEAAVWNAFRDMVPNIAKKACHFHWNARSRARCVIHIGLVCSEMYS